ncbi:MAG: hypothetical protein Q8942_18730 [Bacillota bacterium]|nr:hypothetical protein [Bacillota bacterium]
MDKDKKVSVEMSDEELMDMFGGFASEAKVVQPVTIHPLYGIIAQPLYGVKPPVAQPLYGIKPPVMQPLYGIIVAK